MAQCEQVEGGYALHCSGWGEGQVGGPNVEHSRLQEIECAARGPGAVTEPDCTTFSRGETSAGASRVGRDSLRAGSESPRKPLRSACCPLREFWLLRLTVGNG